MGSLQTVNVQQYDDGSNAQLKINIDYKKPVILELKPLLHWSLQQIRQIYAPLRQRKGSPLLSRSQFLRFIRLSRIMSFHLFDQMCRKRNQFIKKDSLNVFQIVSILVLTAYTTYSNKIQFLFNIFDLDSSRGLQFKELILSFKSLIRGYCILTQQPLPSNQLLEKYGQIMFSRADLNNDQCLQLGEVLSWFQGNVQGIYLFKKFQPNDSVGKVQYHIFNSFIPYSEPEIKLLYQRLDKQYKKTPLSQQDFQPLNHLKHNFKRSDSKNYTEDILSKSNRMERKQSKFKPQTTYLQSATDQFDRQKKVVFSLLTKRNSANKSQSYFPKFNREDSIFTDNFCEQIQNQPVKETFKSGKFASKLSKKTSCLNSSNKFQASKLNSSRQKRTIKQISNNILKGSQTTRNLTLQTVKSIKGPGLNSLQATALDLSQVNLIKKKFTKKRFQNIIILKGKTITKTQIFDLRDYFEGMSGGKKAISIQNFIESFNDEKYNHMKSVAASLFNFLDRDQNGKVTFKQLIQKLYPDLTVEHYDIIKLWNNQYNQNFNLEKKIKANRQHEQLKKRILPKTCVARYQQMFNFFDRNKKGFVDFDDLKRVLSDVSTEKQLVEVFIENDKDKDGRLNIKQFLHILLPMDLQIEGI